MKHFAIGAVAVAGLMAAPARAGDLPLDSDLAKSLGISELRAGVMMDDVELYGPPFWTVPQPQSFHGQNIDTLSADVLFNTPVFTGFLNKPDIGWFNWVLDPRPALGFDLNFKHESVVHASLNWHLPIGNSRFFFEPELGASLNNSDLNPATRPLQWRDVGCNALFYWSINIGYQVDEHWNIMATEEHSSQGGACGWTHNEGINYEGFRIGYRL